MASFPSGLENSQVVCGMSLTMYHRPASLTSPTVPSLPQSVQAAVTKDRDISHSSGGWEVQDHDAGRLGVWWQHTSWFINTQWRGAGSFLGPLL